MKSRSKTVSDRRHRAARRNGPDGRARRADDRRASAERCEHEPGTRVVDLEGRTVMPGLIDCHIHFALWGFDPAGAPGRAALVPLRQDASGRSRTRSSAGCTAARDPGGLDAGFRDAIDGRDVPRTADPDEHHDRLPDERHRRQRRGPGPARCRIRPACRHRMQRARRSPGEGPRGRPGRRGLHQDRRLRRRELAPPEPAPPPLHGGGDRRRSSTRHTRGGSRSPAHAIGGPGRSRRSARVSTRSSMAVWLDDECVEEMARRGTWYVPTLRRATSGTRCTAAPAAELAPRRSREAHRASFERARGGGRPRSPAARTRVSTAMTSSASSSCSSRQG